VTQGTTTTESYTFDPVGNRLSSLGVSPYNVNASNELTSTPNASYTYDSNGNTLTKVVGSNTTTYAWDFENRMTSVALPGLGGTVSFKYDPFGRRIYKSSSTATSIYAYDGGNLIEETNSSGTAVARYSHQGINVDEPLAMLRSGATSYYQADALGSVTSLSSAAGSIANSYTYDSFGKLTASSGSLTNPFQYTGREFDAETGLYFYRTRYLDTSTGRFLTEDPLMFDGGSNFYDYVANNPIEFVDPSGEQALPKPLPTPKPPVGPILVPDPLKEPELDACASNPWICAIIISLWPTSNGLDDLVPAPGPNYSPRKKPGNCKPQDGCKPCVPPVGTISYEAHSGPGRSGTGVHHGPFPGDHWHLYEMHQRPAPDCTCFWVEIGSGQGPIKRPWPVKSDPGGGSPIK
jgi:RHS repeat-associated protein